MLDKLANGVNPDQTPRFVVSDLDIHCSFSFRSVCPNSYDHFGISPNRCKN